MQSRKKTFTNDYNKNEDTDDDFSEKIQSGNIVTISEKISERIKSANSKSYNSSNDEDAYWIEKLRCIDKDHTRLNHLNIREVERYLGSLMNFVEKSQRCCPVEANKLTKCFEQKKGQTLVCRPEVEEFVNCVDKMFYETVRQNPDYKSKRFTYAELFDQPY